MSLYSARVMEHFRNPRNMGEIPDADGIGTVGNPVCLTPETLVVSNSHVKEIKSIVSGDSVLGHDGVYHAVEAVHERPYAGLICKIHAHNLGETRLTPDHHVLALKTSPTAQKFRFYKRHKPDWYLAGELEKGDTLLYPIPREVQDRPSIKLDVATSRWDFSSKALPGEVSVSEPFLLLAGYYLAEGYVRTERSKGTLGFVMGSTEEKYVDEIISSMKAVFGLSPKVMRHHSAVEIVYYSARLARFFECLLGRGAANKRLPHWMMLLPSEKQVSLLRGLWRGDGHIYERGAKYVTISRQLAFQVRTMLMRQGIGFSFITFPAKGMHKEYCSIYVRDTASLRKLAGIVDAPVVVPPRSKRPHKAWCDEQFYYVPIRRVSVSPFHGPILNLEVEGCHSFTSGSATLHNCGDMMSVYIKVKGDVIEDVKFKTFGCGAAIATSSMITELAKGKTITEALRITRTDIVQGLGGLPPIKLHCSVLAVDGLSEAIYEYHKRRNLPVPRELEERHEKTRREFENIEKRYEEFLKLEKELL